MKVLIIGNGQIGQAIKNILSPFHDVHIRDLKDYPLTGVDYLHICYPDSQSFVNDTKKYVEEYHPRLTLIHSSIGIGKTHDLGEGVVHCPIRGRHPHLTDQIPAFPIFVGGENKENVKEAAEYLAGCNLVCKMVYDSMATEACKILSNVHMGLEIAWRQEVGRIFEYLGLDQRVYEEWEDSYNEGYRITNNEQLTRPRLRTDPIGGHCILECTDIIGKTFKSKAFEFIKESNETEKAKRSKARTPETVNA